MKTCLLLWWFSLERDMFRTSVVEKIRTHVVLAISFFLLHWKSFRLWDNAQKYGTAEDATDGSIIRRIVDAVCMLDNQGKSKDRLVIFDTCCFFHGKNGYSNAPQSHVIRTLLVLFRLSQPYGTGTEIALLIWLYVWNSSMIAERTFLNAVVWRPMKTVDASKIGSREI
jgi:hypothetical protein